MKKICFEGYLLKKDGVLFPPRFIALGSYSATPNQRQDLDSYRDSTGELYRNILPHKVTKIEFTTPPLHLKDKEELTHLLKNRDQFQLEFWDDEEDAYRTGTFYCPDIKFEIYRTDPRKKDIWYLPIRIAMIEY